MIWFFATVLAMGVAALILLVHHLIGVSNALWSIDARLRDGVRVAGQSAKEKQHGT